MIADIKNEKTFSKKVCSEVSFRAPPRNHQFLTRLPEKKNSRSLDDLCKQDFQFPSSQRNDSLLPSDKHSYRNCPVTPDCNDHSNRFARRCVVSLLMLNAWRRQKKGYRAAQEEIDSLSEKVQSFEMQVYVLRQLLNAEKRRVEATNDNIHSLVRKIKECDEEKASLIKEKESLARSFNQMITQLKSTLKNQENTIITSKLEMAKWEQQLRNEREKMRKMEREEVLLKQEIQFIEKSLKDKTQQIDQLMQANLELYNKLDAQIVQVDLNNARLRQLKDRETHLEKLLQDKEKQIKNLKAAITLLETRLREEDEKNGLLGKSILEKSNELAAVQNKLLELSNNSCPWSAGIVKAASFCAKIPVACICTVGSLLLPFPSYRL